MGNLQAVGRGDQPAELTLNQRLNTLSGNFANSCDRLENVLGRVNGAPTANAGIGGVAPTPQFAMGEMVSRLEEQVSKLAALVDGAERIA